MLGALAEMIMGRAEPKQVPVATTTKAKAMVARAMMNVKLKAVVAVAATKGVAMTLATMAGVMATMTTGLQMKMKKRRREKMRKKTRRKQPLETPT